MEGWLVAFPKPAVIEEVTIYLTRPGVAARIGRWRCTTKGALSSSSGITRRVSRSSRHVQNVYLNRLDLHITQTRVCAPRLIRSHLFHYSCCTPASAAYTSLAMQSFRGIAALGLLASLLYHVAASPVSPGGRFHNKRAITAAFSGQTYDFPDPSLEQVSTAPSLCGSHDYLTLLSRHGHLMAGSGMRLQPMATGTTSKWLWPTLQMGHGVSSTMMLCLTADLGPRVPTTGRLTSSGCPQRETTSTL